MIIAAAGISVESYFEVVSIIQSFASPIAHLLRFGIKTLSDMQTSVISGSSSLHKVGSLAQRSSKALSVGRKLYRRSAAKRTSAEQEDRQVSESGRFATLNVACMQCL